jgi:hypothetical protein
MQLGFAGSRLLYAATPASAAQAATWDAQVKSGLEAVLRALPAPPSAGVSQVAIGADTVFTRACQALGIAQRVLLPQPLDDFLAAGEPGAPDFDPAQKAVARALLASPHIVDVRVASAATDRAQRFEDTNAEIVRASDALLCLLREGAGALRGGTHDLIGRARAQGKPVAVYEVVLRDGHAALRRAE